MQQASNGALTMRAPELSIDDLGLRRCSNGYYVAGSCSAPAKATPARVPRGWSNSLAPLSGTKSGPRSPRTQLKALRLQVSSFSTLGTARHAAV